METFVYLIRCALHGLKADKIDTEKLHDAYKMSLRHHLVSLCFAPIEDTAVKDEAPELYEEWKTQRDKNVRKSLLMEFERRKIFQALEEVKIPYLPLKGSILRFYYPDPNLRQMSDTDILIGIADAARARDVMKAQGYKVESFDQSNHDTYHKKPVYNFELHTSLFAEKAEQRRYVYFADILERLPNANGSEYRKEFSPEDFYLYVQTHAFKHFSGGGTGLRSLVDVYVYLSSADLDFDYVEAEAEKIGISEYERHSRSLAMKLFAKDFTGFAGLSESEMKVFERMLGSGVYGTIQNSVNGAVKKIMDGEKLSKKEARFVYIKNRLFPKYDDIKRCYPKFFQTKIGKPFLYPYRMILALTVRRKKIYSERRALRNVK